MAHQCLQCGAVYEEGSPELLKGCAECGGTRFFFTQAPLDEHARDEIRAKANDDLRSIVRDLLEEGVKPDYDDDVWSLSSRKQWLALDPKDAGKTVREYVEEVARREQGEAAAGDGEAPAPDAADEARGEALEELEALVERKGQGRVLDALDIDFVTDDAGEAEDADVVEVDPFIGPEAPEAPEAPDGADEAEAPEVPDAPAPTAVEAAPGPDADAAEEDEPQLEAEPARSDFSLDADEETRAPPPPGQAADPDDLGLDVDVGPGSEQAEAAEAKAQAAAAADAGDRAAVTPQPAPEDLWVVEDGAEDDGEARPEVVTVTEPGSYEIDVEALLHDSPIIVQNDGTYLVHLPSLFHSKALRKP